MDAFHEVEPMKYLIATTTMLAVSGLFACGSVPAPTAKVASSEAAVRAADELKANDTPAAQLHLKLAQDQLESAKKLIEQGENKRAEYVLTRAQADAELAVALAKETALSKEAQAAMAKVQELQAK